jgi:hypothetical protein
MIDRLLRHRMACLLASGVVMICAAQPAASRATAGNSTQAYVNLPEQPMVVPEVRSSMSWDQSSVASPFSTYTYRVGNRGVAPHAIAEVIVDCNPVCDTRGNGFFSNLREGYIYASHTLDGVPVPKGWQAKVGALTGYTPLVSVVWRAQSASAEVRPGTHGSRALNLGFRTQALPSLRRMYLAANDNAAAVLGESDVFLPRAVSRTWVLAPAVLLPQPFKANPALASLRSEIGRLRVASLLPEASVEVLDHHLADAMDCYSGLEDAAQCMGHLRAARNVLAATASTDAGASANSPRLDSAGRAPADLAQDVVVFDLDYLIATIGTTPASSMLNPLPPSPRTDIDTRQ